MLERSLKSIRLSGMDAPKCKLCSVRHWGPVCGPAAPRKIGGLDRSEDTLNEATLESALEELGRIKGGKLDGRMVVREAVVRPLTKPLAADFVVHEIHVAGSDPELTEAARSYSEKLAKSFVEAKAAKFDRNAYQRQYMADQKLAKAEGLTVKQWREKHGK
mgnify:CR=1 FL=1